MTSLPSVTCLGSKLLVALVTGATACCVAVAPAAAGDLCFESTPYPVGSAPSSVTMPDLNGDGLRDLVVANHDIVLDNRISILINNGDGTFAPGVFYDAGSRPYWSAFGDIDADGDVDVAVTNYFDTTVSIYLNNGDGTLAPQITYEVGSGPGFVVMAHLDRDSDLDLAVSNINDYTVSILLNNGDGTFARQVTYDAGPGPYGVVAADFDNDGALDLAMSDHHSNTVTVLRNNGDGTFVLSTTCTVEEGPVGNDSADLNNDGFRDLVTANAQQGAGGTTLSVLMNNGDGTFAAQVPYEVPTGPYTIKIADFNADGYGDLATSHESGFVTVMINNGDGTFAEPMSFPVGLLPVGLDVGDLDGNGTPEIAVTCYDADEIWVLFNQYAGITAQPAPVSAYAGENVLFAVEVSGPPPFTFQWRRDGVDLADGGAISGATTDTLTIDPVSAADAGTYDVVVSNDCGPVVSDGALLEINPGTPCPADLNGDGFVNSLDLGILLASWSIPSTAPACGGSLPCPADIDHSGFVNSIDLGILLASWSIPATAPGCS